MFTNLSDNLPTDMIDAPFVVKVNNSNLVDVHKAIDFILKTKLHLRPLQGKYFYTSSRESDKNNYIAVSSYNGRAYAEEKNARTPSIVLPFIYVNDQH